jgi:hypothetical protein
MNPDVSPTPNPDGPTKWETLLGTQEVEVMHLDGVKEQIKVRQLPIRCYPAYLEAQDDELKQIELLAGRAPGWAESLTIVSVEAILAAGDRLNADFFGRWLRRRMQRLARFQSPPS